MRFLPHNSTSFPVSMMHQQSATPHYSSAQAGGQHYQGQQAMGMMGQGSQGNSMMSQRPMGSYRSSQQGRWCHLGLTVGSVSVNVCLSDGVHTWSCLGVELDWSGQLVSKCASWVFILFEMLCSVLYFHAINNRSWKKADWRCTSDIHFFRLCNQVTFATSACA